MRLLILIFSTGAVFFSCSLSSDADEESSDMSIAISAPNNQAIVSDSVLIDLEIGDDSMISKVELWVNNDSTGIQDLTPPFSILWNTKDYKNSSYDIFVRSYDMQGKKFDSGTITITISNFLVFSKTFGSNEKSELGRSIIQTIDSGFVMLGEVDNDILLMKSNRYGDMEWQQSFGGSQTDIASHIEQASDGGFIISATTESYGQGGKDIWLFKTSSSGLIEWNKYIGTPYDDYSGQVLETEDGGFIVIGSKGSSDQNDNDIWLIKTNSQGDSSWTRSYGGSQFDRGNDILADNQGGFILLGSTESQGNGGKDIWLLKVDENGNDQWNNTYGNGSDDIGQSMIRTLDGGFLIRYLIESYGEGNTSVGLLRLGPNRQELWTKTVGGSMGITGRGFQKVSDDEYMMSCSLFDNGKNSYNAYIIKIGDSGDIIWDKIFGGEESDRARSIVQTLDGGYAIAGSTCNYGNGNKLDPDLWLIKTDSEGYSRSFDD
ncbi:MAG: Ig-like domain-containing protein [Candidatus Neomarinimicrobiota bacterium]